VSAKKCVLAYSGGLDTSAMVPWLLEKGYEVHAVLVDVGQEEDLGTLCRKALRYGATTAVVRDAKPAMFQHVIPLAIGLCATYEGNYRLGTALARPFIAAEQVKVAKQLGGATLAHGATGKGNDQVRFEFGYRSLAPEYPVLAPWKTWEFGGRVDLVNYLKKKGFKDNYAVQKDFSLDENLWHISVEGGPLEEPGTTVDIEEVLHSVDGLFAWNNTFGPAPAAVEVKFQAGVPVALNGQAKGLAEIVSQLNHQYRQAPWAWDLIIENRFTGVKSRGVYINPAAKLLHLAIDNLARTCLNKPTYDQYMKLGQ
jgi:argininosuccinate synthase